VTLLALSVAQLGEGLRAGRFTSEDITRAALERIAGADGAIHAFVRVEADAALVAARQADAELRAGNDRSPLHGIPYATKDIYDVTGLPTTCHSYLRLDHVAKADAAVTQRLRAGGAVLLGKLATFEFALGGTSFDLPFPPARNPWNLEHIPGGSSSGSAAAVAAGFVRLATGSCTSGSIRGPAAWCGVVGLKPSFGRVSRRGVFPLSWTMDHCGPLARTVEDAAIALQVMAGHDILDPGSIDRPVPDYTAGLGGGVRGLRVGVPRAFFEGAETLTADAHRGISETLAHLRRDGAVVEDVRLPDLAQFIACSRIIMAAESFAIHRRDLACRFGDYGEAAARRFVQGAGIGAADYLDAQRLRSWLAATVVAALRDNDVLITAISLATAPHFASQAGSVSWPLQASPFNVTGHPALSVPVGLGRNGLPLAVQVVGRPFDEVGVLRVGRAVERMTGWEAVPLPDLPAG
jgi:aspartyl-tRNA(Asn)/glutamyl-tRNA(Gln) amidotransferase subunit A